MIRYGEGQKRRRKDEEGGRKKLMRDREKARKVKRERKVNGKRDEEKGEKTER